MRSILFEAALWTALATTSVATSSVPYFNVTNVEVVNSLADTVFFLNVKDPRTGNSTYCATSFTGVAPVSSWMRCDDTTFSWKIDSFKDPSGRFQGEDRTKQIETVEIKHQYRSAGKQCVKSNGPQCTTTRAYLNLRVSDAVLSGGEENGPAFESIRGTWAGPYVATVFSSCNAGCGISAGSE